MGDKETVIGPETRIAGEVRGEEDLVVRGRIEGKIQLSQTLTVDDGGIVQADVDVRALVVAGVVVGTIHASESVRLTGKARVVGDITSPKLIVDAGATYRGRVDMGQADGARSSERKASAARSVPPRIAAAPPRAVAVAAPPRAAVPSRLPSPSVATASTSSIRGPSAPAAPPRVSSVPRPPTPPPLPRAEVAASASAAPAWAKKKLRRR
jgi:cytoskeletal protein CcmA (bactofilin family)